MLRTFATPVGGGHPDLPYLGTVFLVSWVARELGTSRTMHAATHFGSTTARGDKLWLFGLIPLPRIETKLAPSSDILWFLNATHLASAPQLLLGGIAAAGVRNHPFRMAPREAGGIADRQVGCDLTNCQTPNPQSLKTTLI